MTTAMLASVLAALVLSFVAIFQILLAIGLPLGEAAWGGTHRVLPPHLRVASALSSLLLGLDRGPDAAKPTLTTDGSGSSIIFSKNCKMLAPQQTRSLPALK